MSPRRAALPEEVTVVDVAAGGGTTCALTANGVVYCWGNNLYGQVGDGTAVNAMLPVPVDTSLLAEGVTFTAIAVGSTHTCAVGSDREVYCWGQAARSGPAPDRSTHCVRRHRSCRRGECSVSVLRRLVDVLLTVAAGAGVLGLALFILVQTGSCRPSS
ncbi:hypothetical protein NKG05_12945 [Oerskovia sp. M15]